MKSQSRVINLTFRSLTALVVLMSWVTGEVARAVPDRWGVKDFTRKLNPHRVPEESFSASVLTSLLFNPEPEERREGYRVKEKEEGRHIALEAPQTVLRPWFQRTSATSHHLTTHHSLLSQPEMTQAISPAVRDRLCNLSHDIVVLRWLEGVREPLSRAQVTRFSETLETMQTVLSGPDSYTHQTLFRLVHPAAAFLYEQPGFDPHQSMEAICQTQQIDPRDKRLRDYQGHKHTLRALVGQNVEEIPSTDAAHAQSCVREIMAQRDLHHVSDKIGQTYFEAASAFLWTQEDVERFHSSWRDKAPSFLHFNLPDQGRFVRFCCLLGANPQTTPCLEKAISSLHVGTVANLRTLFDFGADAAREPGVLRKTLEARWTLREHEHAPVLSEALALLVEKAPTQDVPLSHALALLSLSSRDEILKRVLTRLADRHMPFGWEVMWHTLFARDPSLPNHTRLQTAAKDYGLPSDLYRRLYPRGVFDPIRENRLSHLTPGDLRQGKRLVGILYGDEGKTRGLCFKQFPEFPGIEYAIHTLGKRLFGTTVTPPGRSARMGGDVFWVSHFVPGPTLQAVLDKSPDPEELKNLEPQGLGESIILSILTNPEDGRPPNYIVTSSDRDPKLQKIVCIDNDHSFGSGCLQKVREGLFRTTEVKGSCALFCLDQMDSKVDDSIRETFLKLDLKKLFEEWIADLRAWEAESRSLFKNSDGNPDFDTVRALQDHPDHPVALDFPIPSAWLKHLYHKLLTMQRLIAGDVDNKLTYLKLLESCEPSVGRRYAAAAQKFTEGHHHVRQRVEETDSREMSRTSVHTYLREILGIKDGQTTLTEGERNALYFGSIDDIMAMLQGFHTTQELKFEKEAAAFENRSAAEQELLIATLSRDPQRVPADGAAALLPSSPQPSFATMPDSEQKKWLKLIQDKGKQDISQLHLAHCRMLENTDFARMPLQNLRVVCLRDCPQVTHEGVATLAQGAEGLQELTLQALTLQALPLIAKRAIIPFFRRELLPIPFPSLMVLILDNLPGLESLHVEASRLRKLLLTDCPRLQDVSWGKQTLKELILPRVCQIAEKEILEQARSLSTYQTLIHLSQPIRNTIIPLLDTSLTDLTLNPNQIGGAAAIVLAKLLQENTSLRKLSLIYNKIGDAGATALAPALQANIALTELDLSYNQIDDAGAAALAPALQANTTLTKLTLGINKIGDAGATALAPALQANTALTELVLSLNQIGDVLESQIDALIARNKQLTVARGPQGQAAPGIVFDPQEERGWAWGERDFPPHNAERERPVLSVQERETLDETYGPVPREIPSEKSLSFLSLQGNPDPLLEDLEKAFSGFLYTGKKGRVQQASLQKVFKGFSGSGRGGALALLLFQQHNPHPTSSEIKHAFSHDKLPNADTRISETARPFVLTMADSSGISVTPYDYRRAQEDDAHNISVGELARRLSQSPASDGSLALYRYRKPHQQPLFVVFGASPNTPETLAAIRERGDYVVFVGPQTDIPQLANLLCVRAGLTRRPESIPDPLAETFDAEIARVNQLLSDSLTKFYESLGKGGAAGGVPSPEETQAAQAEIAYILAGHEKRSRKAHSSWLSVVLLKKRELEHKLLGHAVSFQDTFEKKIAREHKAHLEDLRKIYSEDAFESLQAYREWKRGVWMGALDCQLQKAFSTYSTLASGTVARKSGLKDYLLNKAISGIEHVGEDLDGKILELIPLPGISAIIKELHIPIVSTLASVGHKIHELHEEAELNKLCNRITSLWGHEDLRAIIALSERLAQGLGARLNPKTVDVLTVESLQRLAFLTVDQVIAYVVQNKEGTPSPDDLLTAPFADDKEWLGSFIDGWTELSQESPDAPNLQAWPLLQKNRLEEAQGGARGGAANLMHLGRRRVGL